MKAIANRLRCAAACVLLISAASCGRTGADAEDSAGDPPVVPVRVRAIEVRTFHEAVSAPGQWKAANSIAVTAPFGAYVESLRVEVGDVVTKGATLGVLVTHESRAAVFGAEQLVAAAADPAARAEAERALRQARRDLVRVPLVAAAPGTVYRRSVTPGAEVAEGAELLAILSAHSLVFEAHVPVRDALGVAVGQPAHIRMEDGTVLEAIVQRRLPQTSPGDQTALVWLVTERAATPVLLDRFGTADIATGPPRRAPAVPDSALVEDDLTGEMRVAAVGAAGIATWSTVRLGLAAGGWHELRSPALAAGTRVIVSGQRGLPDSTHVTIEP